MYAKTMACVYCVLYFANAFGTLYTAIYNPLFRAMEYRWPYHVRMYQSFEVFIEQTLWVSYCV